MYQEAADIRDVYLYKKFAVASGVLVHGGDDLSWTCLVSGLLNFEHPSVLLFCYRQKTKGVSA